MNTLKQGMIFKNSSEAARFLGFNDVSRSNQNLSRLSHFCVYHRDENKQIYIDEVFENVIPFRDNHFKYEDGELVNTNTGTIEILSSYIGRKYGSNCKMCKCLCVKHKYEFEIIESRISSLKIGCPICGGKKAIPSIRSLYDTRPDLRKYIVNQEQAKNITPRCNKKILCQCPDCGYLKEIRVDNLFGYGFVCDVCSDGISYPNKFITCLLQQTSFSFKTEKSFDWSDNKRYDHYIESKLIVIENHGLQHYENIDGYKYGDLESIQENDRNKKEIAIAHGLKYFVIDCRESKKEWIKNSILQSGLLDELNIDPSKIDWNLCDEFGRSNRNREIQNDWNKTHDAYYIMNKYGIGETTLRSCINEGFDNGYCDIRYCKNELLNISLDAHERQIMATTQSRSKPIWCVTDDVYFHSKEECYQYYDNIFPRKTKANNLYLFINSQREYKGKKFVYISKKEFNDHKMISESNGTNNVFGDYYYDRYI